MGDINLRVVASHSAENEEKHVLISIQPPAGTIRTPVDICCVIDISGSMKDPASIKSSVSGM